MLYKAKSNEDIGVKSCKVIGNGDIFGYELVNSYFVDNSGLGCYDEPALTFEKFLNKVRAGYYYGIKEAGQFQVLIGEYKKLTSLELKIKKEVDGIVNSKKISKSCRIINYTNGDKTIKLYTTDILQFKNNKIVLNSGGYKTVTTKTRMNDFLPDDVRVYQKENNWYIDYNGKILEFFDGIEL